MRFLLLLLFFLPPLHHLAFCLLSITLYPFVSLSLTYTHTLSLRLTPYRFVSCLCISLSARVCPPLTILSFFPFPPSITWPFVFSRSRCIPSSLSLSFSHTHSITWSLSPYRFVPLPHVSVSPLSVCLCPPLTLLSIFSPLPPHTHVRLRDGDLLGRGVFADEIEQRPNHRLLKEAHKNDFCQLGHQQTRVDMMLNHRLVCCREGISARRNGRREQEGEERQCLRFRLQRTEWKERLGHLQTERSEAGSWNEGGACQVERESV